MIFLRFRVREAASLDISTLLMRSLQPFGGARACVDGGPLDIVRGAPWRLASGFRGRPARHRPGIVERVTASASNIERIHRLPVREGSYLRFHFTRLPCIQSEEDARISSMRVLLPGRNSRDKSTRRIWWTTGILPGDGSGPTSRTRRGLLRSISSLRAASLASHVTYFVPTNMESTQRRRSPLWRLLSQGKSQQRMLLSSQMMKHPHVAKNIAPRTQIV